LTKSHFSQGRLKSKQEPGKLLPATGVNSLEAELNHKNLLSDRSFSLYMFIMKKHRNSSPRLDAPPGYHCRGRLWIEKDGETFVGFGRIVLLERIAEHGSISKAARSMEMSYKHAWDLVDSMNRNAATPLVAKSTGGKGGGGAVLTEAGEKIIRDFHYLHQRLNDFLATETAKLQL